MESLLRDNPVLNGFEIQPLLQLLRKILEMRNQFRLSDRDLYDVV
jgi:hypothetical protein